MKTLKIGIILLAFLLAGMVIVPLVSADPSSETLSASQLNEIKTLVGQNITLGEYYEKISPDILTNMPASLKKRIYQTKMQWPESFSKTNSIAHSIKNTSITSVHKTVNDSLHFNGNNSNPISNTDTVQPNEILVESRSGDGVNGESIDYLTESFTSPSGTIFPYMEDTSTLYRLDDTDQWVPVSSVSNSRYISSWDIAEKTISAYQGIYIVMGESSGITPIGSNPPDYIQYTESGIFTVN